MFEIGQNFLSNLAKSGALNVYNPMETYMAGMQMKLGEQKLQSAKLDDEGKLLEITKGYAQRINNRDDYGKFRKYMINNFGDRFNSLPESFNSEEELQAWQIAATTTAAERLKMKKGEEFEIWTRDENGLTTKNKNMTADKLLGLQKLGVLKQYGKDWGFGEVTHQPEKPLERITAEKKAEEQGKLEAGTAQTAEQRKQDEIAKEQRELENKEAWERIRQDIDPNLKETPADKEAREKRMIDYRAAKEAPFKETPAQKEAREGRLIKLRETISKSSTSEKMAISAQAAGIDLKKIADKKLDAAEAKKLAKAYMDDWGAESFIEALFGGNVKAGGGGQPAIKFDEKGNPIK